MSLNHSIGTSIFPKPRFAIGTMLLSIVFTSCGENFSRDTILEEHSEGLQLVPTIDLAQLQTCEDVNDQNGQIRQLNTRAVSQKGIRWELEFRPAVCQLCRETPHADLSDTIYMHDLDKRRQSSTYVLRAFHGTKSNGTATQLSSIKNNDIQLIANGDSSSCSFIHVENLPEMVPYESALLAFPQEEHTSRHIVLIRDRENTLGGDLTFSFHTN